MNEPKLRDTMLEKRSDGAGIRTQSWRIGAWILAAVLFVAVIKPASKVYLVQEALAVLLLVAVSTGTIFAFVVAFLLFREGIRWTIQCMKLGYIWVAHLGPQQR
jgi:hypothetical protein